MNREGKITNTWGTPETLKLPHLMAVTSKASYWCRSERQADSTLSSLSIQSDRTSLS